MGLDFCCLIKLFFIVCVINVALGIPTDPTQSPDKPTTKVPNVDVTTDKPEEETTKKPGEDTTKKPDEVTTKKPDEDTTNEPDEGTTSKPDEETTSKPDVDTTNESDDEVTTKTSVIAVGVNTGDKLQQWSEAAKNAVKRPTELVKESVNILKEGMKLSSNLGEATVAKGIAQLGKQGVATVSDLGKMGINVTTTIANNTLGLIHKIGDMMPFGGKLVKGGVSIGRKGLTVAKAIGENFFDNLRWIADNGFGWLKNTASSSKTFFHNKTDSLVSSINEGIDNGAGRITDIISAGISKLPIFRVNASLTLG